MYYAVLIQSRNLATLETVRARVFSPKKRNVGLRRVSAERVLERGCLVASEHHMEGYRARCPTGRPTRRLQTFVLSFTDGRGHASNQIPFRRVRLCCN